MPGDWSRRALLASLAAVATAGCGADGGSDGGAGATTDTPTDVTATDATQTDTPTDATPTETTTTPAPDPPASVDSSWPMPGGGPGQHNAVDAPGPAGEVGELWRVDAGTTLSSPVVAGTSTAGVEAGLALVGGDDGVVRALDAGTGESVWRQSVGAAAHAPRVVGDRCVVPTDAGLVALALADGREHWRTETPGRADLDEGTVTTLARATVLAADHGCYWLAGDPADGPGELVALDPADGGERWRVSLERPWSRRLFAGPERVFVSSDSHAQVPWTVRPDGEVVAAPSGRGNDFREERCYRDGTLYRVSGFWGTVEARSVGDGGHDWDTSVPGGRFAVSAGPDRVYVAGSRGPKLTALAATDGSTAWSADVVPGGGHRPVVAGDCVLVRADDELRCLDPADGTALWTRPADGIDHLAVADDLLYVTGDGTIRALRPA